MASSEPTTDAPQQNQRRKWKAAFSQRMRLTSEARPLFCDMRRIQFRTMMMTTSIIVTEKSSNKNQRKVNENTDSTRLSSYLARN